MAIPPDPIQDLIPEVAAAFDGVVVEVLETGADEPVPPHAPGAADVGIKAPRQVVRLEVREVYSGGLQVGTNVDVVKPAAGYALRAGNQGPFLIDGGAPQPTILGRYGPDSYSTDAVRDAFGAG